MTECPYPYYIKVPDNKAYPFAYYRIPCGKCLFCRQRMANNWYVRVKQDIGNRPAFFVTLTYADEFLPYSETGLPAVSRSDFTNFMKRFRKLVGLQGIKYFACSEYGPMTFRPHYHMLLWNIPGINKEALSLALLETWTKGFIQVDPVNDERIRYVVKYQLELPSEFTNDYEPVFRMMSKGIGKGYVDKNQVYHRGRLDRYFYRDGEFHYPLPRYWSEKLYTKLERASITAEHKSEDFKSHEDYVTAVQRIVNAEKNLKRKFSKKRKNG